MKVRIVHLTSAHPDDDVRIFLKECRALADAGYDVQLVAPGDASRDVDGVRVVSVPRPKSRLERATRTMWALYRASTRLKPRIYHFHDPELIPLALFLKIRGACVVYDVHEDLPRQILDKDWIHPLLRRPIATLAAAAEWIAGQAMDAIVTVTPTIAGRFPRDRTVIVHNYPMVADEPPDSVSVPYARRPPTVAYVGGITEPRGVRQMVAAMAEVSSRHEPRLVLAGRAYPAALEIDLAKVPGWERVTMAGWLDRGAVATLLGDARIGIVTFLPLANNVEGYPTKLFEYMAAGLPVIASDFPGWRAIVASADCGLLVDPTDTTAIAAAIDRLLDHPQEAEAMGRRGRRAATMTYDWATERDALLSLYRRLVAGLA